MKYKNIKNKNKINILFNYIYFFIKNAINMQYFLNFIVSKKLQNKYAYYVA